MFGGLSHNDRN